MNNPAEADFILAHGTEAIGQPDGAAPQDASMPHINALLQSCAKQQVPPPMVVANPDVVTVSGSDLIPMPGTLAEYYAGLGGKVCSTPPLLWSEPSGAVGLSFLETHSNMCQTFHHCQHASVLWSTQELSVFKHAHLFVNSELSMFTPSLSLVDSRAQHVVSCSSIQVPSVFGSTFLACSILQIHRLLCRSQVVVQIYWMGKPDPVMYDVALDMLNLPREHILAVGDSLHHDIQGWAHAFAASTVSLLVPNFEAVGMSCCRCLQCWCGLFVYNRRHPCQGPCCQRWRTRHSENVGAVPTAQRTANIHHAGIADMTAKIWLSMWLWCISCGLSC